MMSVAEMAAQVAAAEAYEDSRRSSVKAFALEGIEYLVNFKHFSWIASFLAMTRSVSIKILRRIILDVGGLIVA